MAVSPSITGICMSMRIRSKAWASAAATAERALAASKRADAQMRALDASKTAMQLTESALGDAGELVAQARDLLVSAGNGSYTDSERKTIADAIRGLRQDLLAVSNRKDGAGRYLFGGQGSAGHPLVDGPTGVTYAGSAGQSQAAAGESSPLTMNGQAIWLQAPDPANPGSTLSLFDAMDQVVGELQTPGRTPAQIAQTVGPHATVVELGSGADQARRKATRSVSMT